MTWIRNPALYAINMPIVAYFKSLNFCVDAVCNNCTLEFSFHGQPLNVFKQALFFPNGSLNYQEYIC